MRIIKIFQLIGYYFIDLIKSNIHVAHDIITPGEMGAPQILKIDLRTTKDIHIFILTCLISMTPGSLCLKISRDKKHLWLHYLYPDKIESLLDTIQNKYEKLVVEIF